MLGSHRNVVFVVSAALCQLCLPATVAAQSVDSVVAPETGQQSERFDIHRFQIEGNTLLTADELDQRVAPYLGTRREYGDIQRALEAVELAYRQRGYAAVQVYAPEQELTDGIVRLQAMETVVGALKLEGELHHFDESNVRAALPALREGQTPNAFDLSAQLALNNENPAKQVEVILGLGEAEGTVDAKVKVNESDPLRVSFSLDNTGNAQTGRHRSGIALQHANLWNRDHVGTFSYQTSPEKPEQVSVYSLSYRVPVYAWAGAFDVILAKSTVNAGVMPTTAGNLSFAGSGTVVGLRYTQALPRQGDVTQKLTLGWDIKANDNTCTLGSYGAAGCGPSAVDVTLRPISLAWQRLQVGAGEMTEITASLAANLPGSENGRDADFQAARPSPTGGPGARAQYYVVRGGITHQQVLDGDWQLRLLTQAQWTPQALLAQEQQGLAGSTAVRGFAEREVSRDTGLLLSLEAHTPNLAHALVVPGTLRALAFADAAQGRNHLLAGETQPRSQLASWGLGLRYNESKALSAKLDVAQVVTPNGTRKAGDWHGHFSLNLAF